MAETATAQPDTLPTREAGPALAMPAPNPPHATTESTLAPTSEFVRYFLLAWPARYIFRGIFNGAFSTRLNEFSESLAQKRDGFVEKLFNGGWLKSSNPVHRLEEASALSQNRIFGLGSFALTASYSRMVYHDMFNLFSETVAYETGKSPTEVTFRDIRKSDNRIVDKTVENFYYKTGTRAFLDALFFVPKLARWQFWGDMVLGLKGLQLFAETWKREPTLFEHVAALVNAKINPKNGLGQPLSTGEIFDLYQHYHFQFSPDKAFHNVFDGNSGEARIWAEAKSPVFDRITELMNLTYAYKHATRLDEKTGQPIREADFALPKFLYLLGHDMIDPAKPAQTMLYIEIANTHGMDAVKKAHGALSQGASINDVLTQFPVTLNLTRTAKKELAPQSSKIGTRPTADMAIPTSILNGERTSVGTLHPALVREL